MKIKKFFNFKKKKISNPVNEIDPYGEEIWEDEATVKKLYIDGSVIENPSNDELSKVYYVFNKEIRRFNGYIEDIKIYGGNNVKIVKNGYFSYHIRGSSNTVISLIKVSKNNNFIYLNAIKFETNCVLVECDYAIYDYKEDEEIQFILEFDDIKNALNFLKGRGLNIIYLEKHLKNYKE